MLNSNFVPHKLNPNFIPHRTVTVDFKEKDFDELVLPVCELLGESISGLVRRCVLKECRKVLNENLYIKKGGTKE